MKTVSFSLGGMERRGGWSRICCFGEWTFVGVRRALCSLYRRLMWTAGFTSRRALLAAPLVGRSWGMDPLLPGTGLSTSQGQDLPPWMLSGSHIGLLEWLVPSWASFTWIPFFSLSVGAGLRFLEQSQWPTTWAATWWSVPTKAVSLPTMSSLKCTTEHLFLILGQRISLWMPK